MFRYTLYLVFVLYYETIIIIRKRNRIEYFNIFLFFIFGTILIFQSANIDLIR